MKKVPAYKDKGRNTWYCSFYYTDWTGKRKLKKKRGFQRKKDAEAWEAEFIRLSSQSCDMTFESMTNLYLNDMAPRLKESTMKTKRSMISNKIIPVFGNMPINTITPAHIRTWQSQILKEGQAPGYVKIVNAQLSTIFNYACKYYALKENPVRIAGSIGKKQSREMNIWTLEEFEQFIKYVDSRAAYTAFLTLFWTGIRVGELLALTPKDINFKEKTISITKTYQRLDRKDIVSDPKTYNSRRIIPIPEKLCDALKEHMSRTYNLKENDRIFNFSKFFIFKHMETACALSGIKRIRIHDIRHSHASMLIHFGCPILLIKERLGHKDIQTTLNIYGHLYPSASSEVVKMMEKAME